MGLGFIGDIVGGVGEMVGDVLGVSDEKARVEQQNKMAMQRAMNIGDRYMADLPGQVQQAEALGRRRGEEMYGSAAGLGQQAQALLKKRIASAGGIGGEQMAAMRDIGRRQIAGQTAAQQQQLLAMQGASGLGGATAAAQAAQVGAQGAQQRSDFEKGLLTKQFESQLAGEAAADKSLRSAILAQEAMASGAVGQEMAMRGAMSQLALGTLPTQQAAPGLLSGLVPTVICTELYRQGYLNNRQLMADNEYGKRLRKNNPETFYGYLAVGEPCVEIMQKSKLATLIAYMVVSPWSKYVMKSFGYTEKGSRIGRAINFFGLKLFGIIGKTKIRLKYGKRIWEYNTGR